MNARRLLILNRQPKRPVWAGKGYVLSLHAPHHPDDLVFRRTQSPAMAARKWERESILEKFIGLFQSKGNDNGSVRGGSGRA